MDLEDNETIHTRMLGGVDTAVVNNVSGTDLKKSSSTSPERSAASPATVRRTR